MRSTILLLILPVFMSIGDYSYVQAIDQNQDTTKDRQVKVENILDQMKQEMLHSSTSPDSALSPPFPVPQQIIDDSTKAVYLESLHAYYEYRISGFKHRKKVFAWQLFSSKIIFYVVLLLVFSGICFSGIQFYKSMRKEDGDTPTGGSVTEFEATAKGIKVSSPVLGVIILVISLVFFYLYLVYVYPIQEIF